MYRSGSAPLCRRTNSTDSRFTTRAGLHLSTLASTSFYFLNTRVPPFNDVRARLAVNAAFDRDAFALQQGRGFTRPARSCRRTSCLPTHLPISLRQPARPRCRTTTRQELRHGRHSDYRLGDRRHRRASTLRRLRAQRHRLSSTPQAAEFFPYLRRVSDSRLKIQMGT